MWHERECRSFRLATSESRLRKLREKHVASQLFKGKKVSYPASVTKPFLGDQLGLADPDGAHTAKWAKVVGLCTPGRVMASATATKFNRSNGATVERLIVICSNGAVICESGLKFKYFIQYSSLLQVSVSSQIDNTFVMHVEVGADKATKKGDHLFLAVDVIELVTRTYIAYREKTGEKLKVVAADEFELQSAKKKASLTVQVTQATSPKSPGSPTPNIKLKGKLVSIGISEGEIYPTAESMGAPSSANDSVDWRRGKKARGGSRRLSFAQVFYDLVDDNVVDTAAGSQPGVETGSGLEAAGGKAGDTKAGSVSLDDAYTAPTDGSPRAPIGGEYLETIPSSTTLGISVDSNSQGSRSSDTAGSAVTNRSMAQSSSGEYMETLANRSGSEQSLGFRMDSQDGDSELGEYMV